MSVCLMKSNCYSLIYSSLGSTLLGIIFLCWGERIRSKGVTGTVPVHTLCNQLQIKFLFTALLMMAVGSMVIDTSPSNMMMNNNNNNMMYQIRHRGQNTPRSLLVSSHSRPSFKPIQKTHFVRSPFTNNQVSAVAVFPYFKFRKLDLT